MMTKRRKGASPAFTLVEVALALGIAAFCLVAVFGLLPLGINSNRDSVEQTAAASVARAIIADLRNTPNNPPADETSHEFQIIVPGAAAATHSLFLNESGAGAGKPDTDASPALNPRYRVTLIFTPPKAPSRGPTAVRVLVTWPALADGTVQSPPSHYSGSFEVMTALDRN